MDWRAYHAEMLAFCVPLLRPLFVARLLAQDSEGLPLPLIQLEDMTPVSFMNRNAQALAKIFAGTNLTAQADRSK